MSSHTDSDTVSQAINLLIEKGNALAAASRKPVEFTEHEEAKRLSNDIKGHPHFFVLGCVMDSQIPTERAWMIPYTLSTVFGSAEFSAFHKVHQDEYLKVFEDKRLHRFNTRMAGFFYEAVQRIHNTYNDDASGIWQDKPPSARVVRRFLEFRGVGIKIATMATNSLVREFKIELRDYINIDISPDVHVKRVFSRLGFVREQPTVDEVIYCARELNPTYPGIFDYSAWEIGRKWCKAHNPDCAHCYMEKLCPKIGTLP